MNKKQVILRLELIKTLASMSGSDGRMLDAYHLGINKLIEDLEKICPHCKMDKDLANPSGFCNHLHYPEACEVCEFMVKVKK